MSLVILWVLGTVIPTHSNAPINDFFHCLLQVISGIVEIHCIICIGVFVKLFRGKEVYKGTAEKPYITH